VALAALAGAVPLGYAAVIVGGAALTRRGLGPKESALYPVVLATMHTSWGAGFLRAALRDARTALRAWLRARRSVAAPS
jgi:hypothetical protein